MASITCTALVGSTVVSIGATVTGMTGLLAKHFEVFFRKPTDPSWSNLSNQAHHPLNCGHVWKSEWTFERNMWRVTLDGLTPDTDYEFSVCVGKGGVCPETPIQYIHTLPTYTHSIAWFGSDWSSHAALKNKFTEYWPVLDLNLQAAGVPTIDPLQIKYGSSIASDIWKWTMLSDKYGSLSTVTEMTSELTAYNNDSAATPTISYTILHELRHLFGISYALDASHDPAGWRGLGTCHEMDASTAYVETLSNYTNVYIKSLPNTVGVYTETGTESGGWTRYYANHAGSNVSQLTEVFQFMRGSDLVHPRINWDHSNIIDGSYIYGNGTCIEQMFLLRALMFDKITILHFSGTD